ncbi:MAG: thiolase family protein [Thermodesulfobacteriota bacterium]
MQERVGIVAAAQIAGARFDDNFYDQAFRVTKECLDAAGVSREELGSVVSAASDVFHGSISCANAYYWESVGAFMKNATRQDGESLFALGYGAMRILSGRFDTVLVVGLCKGDENPENDTLTGFFTDPFYLRPLGMNETTAAALQMQIYMEMTGTSAERIAEVAVKNLGNAKNNPGAHRSGDFSVEEVLAEPVAYPLSRLQIAPKSDGMVALLLASEKTARRLTDKPVWLLGYGSSVDSSYLGDRDLLGGALPQAARRAYDMADIKNPAREIHLAELCEPYAFQELLWCEQLGLCGSGNGAELLDSGRTQAGGDLPVNPSGGVLAANPYVSRGLLRVAEAFLQIRGAAGARQVGREVKTALAHGTHGFAGQCHAVAVLGV